MYKHRTLCHLLWQKQQRAQLLMLTHQSFPTWSHTCTQNRHTSKHAHMRAHTHTSKQTSAEHTYISRTDKTQLPKLRCLHFVRCSLCLSSVRGSSPAETALPNLLNACLRAPADVRGSDVFLPCAAGSVLPLAVLGAGRREWVDTLGSVGEGSSKCPSSIASWMSLVSKSSSLPSPLSEFEAMLKNSAETIVRSLTAQVVKGRFVYLIQ